MDSESFASIEEQPEADYFAARRRLLNPPWDRKQLTFREIRRAGWELAGNPHDLRLFGMNPMAWYCLGIRIRGRTAVEVTRDQHAQFLGESVAATLGASGIAVSDVIDPFVGSGNLLFHVLRATKATRGVGLDDNEDVMELTGRNFARLRSFGCLKLRQIALHRQNWISAERHLENKPTLIIVDPPWGDAFDSRGLDTRKTAPPMATILERLAHCAGTAPIFAMLKIHPLMVAESVTEITQKYSTFPSIKSDNPDTSSRVDYILLRLPRVSPH